MTKWILWCWTLHVRFKLTVHWTIILVLSLSILFLSLSGFNRPILSIVFSIHCTPPPPPINLICFVSSFIWTMFDCCFQFARTLHCRLNAYFPTMKKFIRLWMLCSINVAVVASFFSLFFLNLRRFAKFVAYWWSWRSIKKLLCLSLYRIWIKNQAHNDIIFHAWKLYTIWILSDADKSLELSTMKQRENIRDWDRASDRNVE